MANVLKKDNLRKLTFRQVRAALTHNKQYSSVWTAKLEIKGMSESTHRKLIFFAGNPTILRLAYALARSFLQCYYFDICSVWVVEVSHATKWQWQNTLLKCRPRFQHYLSWFSNEIFDEWIKMDLQCTKTILISCMLVHIIHIML